MSAMGTVVDAREMMEAGLVLAVPVALTGVACWCVWRWRARWWGWAIAVACVGAMVWMVARFREEGERAANVQREVDTEFEIMTLTTRLRSMRLLREELRSADGEALVKAMLPDVTNGYRSRVDDEGRIVDLWGNAFRIEVGKETGDVGIFSAGVDEVFGTADDLPRVE
ncbi:hypothetical protein [Luteolibacter soli]|uniref:Type II secretion system protein GspG C-terminal domain-containing protein n=1 Tax=Luteolibacter soli TaxID=3135280 RepID=A0ABU9AVW5_9BACT